MPLNFISHLLFINSKELFLIYLILKKSCRAKVTIIPILQMEKQKQERLYKFAEMTQLVRSGDKVQTLSS